MMDGNEKLYDLVGRSDEFSSHPVGESLTVQSEKDDADINVLMGRFSIGASMPENPRVPTYGDFTGITDFRGAFEAVQRAEELFMEYPADLRARFDNNPQAFLEFCSSEQNIPKMVELGLAKEVMVGNDRVPVVNGVPVNGSGNNVASSGEASGGSSGSNP